LTLSQPDFMVGGVSTTFVGRLDLTGLPPYMPEPAGAVEGAVSSSLAGGDDYLVEVNGKQFTVRVAPDGLRTRAGGRGARSRHKTAEAVGAVTSPMHGVVLRVVVTEGQTVESGDLLLTIEAMKMENEITAPRAGTVIALGTTPGATVDVGTLLATIE
jgi:biotin carboxyl carrier protein